DGEHKLLFSGRYPDLALGDPFEMLVDIPESIRQRVLFDNALSVYGERLLAGRKVAA
ncbi:MAG: hypothetical protein JOY61_08145, partial [Chloroflexi bacterium]|nr:hypothetical protein [Chloroflexota bacterium]